MKASEVKVGALTLGGAILLAGMVSFLGAFRLFDSGYELHVSYPSVSGLMVGNVVRYAGVPIGNVKAMKVDPDKVVVTMHVNKGIQIPQEAVFSIGSDGVMGEKYVDVLPPQKVSGVYISPDTNLTGVPGTGLDQFMANSSKVLDKVEGIADALNNVFGDKEVQKSMRDGFINAREISNNLNTFTRVMARAASENQNEIRGTMLQIHEMSMRMNAAAAHMESLMAGADANGETGRHVAEMARNLAATSRHVEEVSSVLSDVATDPETKKDLQATIHNARSVTARANKALSVFDGVKFKPQADIMHNVKGSDWRANFGLRFDKPEKRTFTYLGAASIGDDTKLDFYLGKTWHGFDLSAGAMQGDFGVGLGYNLGKDFRLYSQLYDFGDSKLRVGGEFRLKRDIYLVGESLDVLHGDRTDTYLGIRSYF